MAYLQIDDWQELRPKLPELTQWRHAALARFLADLGEEEKAGIYADWALSNRSRIPQKMHPWQLWLHNMGRVCQMLEDMPAAVTYYKRSLALCLSDRTGPTVRVMALLPLAGLWKAEGLGGVDLGSAEEKIRHAAEDLNPVHFCPLLKKPVFTEVLENVWTRPEALFPFTYR